jgi:pSer/pThr/pTyr-binding forkhead associated (FHA) protein
MEIRKREVRRRALLHHDESWYCLKGEIAGAVRSLLLKDGPNYVGRTGDVDLTLPGNEVSRAHAIIFCSRMGLEVKDLGSKNGTYVNDIRVQRHEVYVGDTLRFGNIVFKIVSFPKNQKL